MKKVKDILEASSLLGKMINMGGRRAKVTSIAKQGDGRYDTDYEIRFLDDNTKTVLSDPMVRAFMESVEQIDEKYLLASEDLAAVRKQAKQLANKFPTMRFYVIHNKKHVGFGERYEIVTNVNFHMYRNMPIQGQYDGARFMNESVELDEADNTAAVAKQVKQAVKKYVTGTPRVQSKGGKVRFIMLRADKIDNKLRKMILDVEHPNAKVKNMDDIHYANISDRIISAGADVWMDALGLKESVELDECWDTHVQRGYKMKGGKRVPNCVPKDSVEETANVVGNVAGIGGDIPPGKKKKRKKFAGSEVFEVDTEEYSRFMNGSRKKNERWTRKLNMEKTENQEIKSYAHKNPGKAIIVQDKATGMMCYLKPDKY